MDDKSKFEKDINYFKNEVEKGLHDGIKIARGISGEMKNEDMVNYVDSLEQLERCVVQTRLLLSKIYLGPPVAAISSQASAIIKDAERLAQRAKGLVEKMESELPRIPSKMLERQDFNVKMMGLFESCDTRLRSFSAYVANLDLVKHHPGILVSLSEMAAACKNAGDFLQVKTSSSHTEGNSQ